MTMPYNAKALVAAVLSGLGTVGTDAATNPHGVTGTTGIAASIMAIIGYVGTYWTTNGGSPKAAAQGLVVMAQVDGAAFLNYLTSKAPDLLAGAVQAALKGSPSPSAPATTTVIHNYAAAPATDTAPAASGAAEEAILGKAATPVDAPPNA